MPNTESATYSFKYSTVCTIACLSLCHLNMTPVFRILVVSTRCDGTLTTEVYITPTDTGLLHVLQSLTTLHFQSHVDSRFKKGLVNAMVDPAFLLSSTKEGFANDCNKSRTMFSKLSYSETFYIVLHFKDQRSADRVLKDICSQGAMIDVNVKPVFTSRKLSQTLKVKGTNPDLQHSICCILIAM